MLGPQRRPRPKTRQMQPGLAINFMRYKPQRRPRPKTRQISRLRKCRGRTSAGRNGGLARRRGRSGDPVGVHQRLQFGAATEASPEDEADDAEVMRYILDDLTPQRRPRPKTRQIVLGGAQQVREGPASTEASPEDEADLGQMGYTGGDTCVPQRRPRPNKRQMARSPALGVPGIPPQRRPRPEDEADADADADAQRVVGVGGVAATEASPEDEADLTCRR